MFFFVWLYENILQSVFFVGLFAAFKAIHKANNDKTVQLYCFIVLSDGLIVIDHTYFHFNSKVAAYILTVLSAP